MTTTVNVSHIDTCYAEYLTDHHNRDGKLLLGVPINGQTCNSEVKQALLDELNSADFGLPDNLDWDLFEVAIEKWFDGVEAASPFDGYLEVDDEEEWPRAWFLVTYTLE